MLFCNEHLFPYPTGQVYRREHTGPGASDVGADEKRFLLRFLRSSCVELSAQR